MTPTFMINVMPESIFLAWRTNNHDFTPFSFYEEKAMCAIIDGMQFPV